MHGAGSHSVNCQMAVRSLDSDVGTKRNIYRVLQTEASRTCLLSVHTNDNIIPQSNLYQVLPKLFRRAPRFCAKRDETKIVSWDQDHTRFTGTSFTDAPVKSSR
jgi:hypothetical protein